MIRAVIKNHGDEQRIEPKQRRDLLRVAGQVLVERRAAGTPGFCNSMATSGRPLMQQEMQLIKCSVCL